MITRVLEPSKWFRLDAATLRRWEREHRAFPERLKEYDREWVKEFGDGKVKAAEGSERTRGARLGLHGELNSVQRTG